MDKRYDEEILLGYIEGDLSPEDQRLVEQQAAEDPRLRHLLQAMRADRQTLRDLPEPEPPAWLLDEVDRTLERSMLLGDGEAERQAVEQRQRTVLHRIMWTSSIAALFLVAVTVVVVSVTRLGSDSLDYQPELASDGEPAGDDLVAMNTPRDVDEALAERRRDLAPQTLGQAEAEAADAQTNGSVEEPAQTLAFGAGQPGLATDSSAESEALVMSKAGPSPQADVGPEMTRAPEAPFATSDLQAKASPEPPPALADSTKPEVDLFDPPQFDSNEAPIAAQVESTQKAQPVDPSPDVPSALADSATDRLDPFDPPVVMSNAMSAASALQPTPDEQERAPDIPATQVDESLADVQVVVQTRDMGRSLANLSEVARRNRADLRHAAGIPADDRQTAMAEQQPAAPRQSATPQPAGVDAEEPGFTADQATAVTEPAQSARPMALKAGPRRSAQARVEPGPATALAQRLELSVPADQASQVIAELQGPMADGYQRIEVQPLARGPVTQQQLRQADAALAQRRDIDADVDPSTLPGAQIAAEATAPPADPTWPNLQPDYGAILFEQLPLPPEARPRAEQRVVIPVVVEFDDLPDADAAPATPANEPVTDPDTP
jgi:hypothetical protein